MSIEIKIKYFTANNSKGEEVNPKMKVKKVDIGNWIDLFASVGDFIEYNAGDEIMIPLGVAMELPEGYEAHLVARSSTFKRYGVIMTNGMGIVDNSYCGDNDQWYFSAYALRGGTIMNGDRICQFRIVESQPNISFSEVQKLDGKDRGGFGSTGR